MQQEQHKNKYILPKKLRRMKHAIKYNKLNVDAKKENNAIC